MTRIIFFSIHFHLCTTPETMATTFLDSGGEHSSLNKRLNADGKTMFFASSGHEPPACCHPTEQSFVDDDFQRQNPAAPRPHRPCYSEYLHPTNGQDKPTEDAFQLGSYTATEKSFSSGYGTTVLVWLSTLF